MWSPFAIFFPTSLESQLGRQQRGGRGAEISHGLQEWSWNLQLMPHSWFLLHAQRKGEESIVGLQEQSWIPKDFCSCSHPKGLPLCVWKKGEVLQQAENKRAACWKDFSSMWSWNPLAAALLLCPINDLGESLMTATRSAGIVVVEWRSQVAVSPNSCVAQQPRLRCQSYSYFEDYLDTYLELAKRIELNSMIFKRTTPSISCSRAHLPLFLIAAQCVLKNTHTHTPEVSDLWNKMEVHFTNPRYWLSEVRYSTAPAHCTHRE